MHLFCKKVIYYVYTNLDAENRPTFENKSCKPDPTNPSMDHFQYHGGRGRVWCRSVGFHVHVEYLIKPLIKLVHD